MHYGGIYATSKLLYENNLKWKERMLKEMKEKCLRVMQGGYNMIIIYVL